MLRPLLLFNILYQSRRSKMQIKIMYCIYVWLNAIENNNYIPWREMESQHATAFWLGLVLHNLQKKENYSNIFFLFIPNAKHNLCRLCEANYKVETVLEVSINVFVSVASSNTRKLKHDFIYSRSTKFWHLNFSICLIDYVDSYFSKFY